MNRVAAEAEWADKLSNILKALKGNFFVSIYDVL